MSLAVHHRPVGSGLAQPTARPSARSPRDDPFPCLDGFRAIAALSVLLYHVLGAFELHTGVLGAYTARLGNYGVAIFFVLSGFLLYRPFARAALTGAPPPDWRGFLRRRFLRILPAYWAALTAWLYIFRVRPPKGWSDALTFYGLAQNYRSGYVLAGLFVAWTLCIELAFYVALPLLAWLLRRLSTRGATLAVRVRHQLVGLAVVGASGIAYRAAALAANPTDRTPLAWLPAFLDWFALGLALSVLRLAADWGNPLPRALRWLSHHPWASWLFAAEVYWIGAQLGLPRAFGPTAGWQTMGRFVINGLSAALLLLPGLLGPQRHGGLRWALASRPAVALGQVSYGIYLWHALWLHVVRQAWPDAGALTTAVSVVGLTLLAAEASFHLIERPAMVLAAPPPG